MINSECRLKELPRETVRLLGSSQVITSVFSVVKELTENSIDAGATVIDLKMENYGLDKIEVRDNGEGIASVEMPYVVKSHHTSKITAFSDLEKLSTYGFRGEALGSLCSVSSLSITSKTAQDMVSLTYTFNHQGQITGSKPSHLGQGTTITAVNLFKNLPVRRQYYNSSKKKKEEVKRIEDIFMAFGIIHPEIRFTLRHNRDLLWQKNSAADLKASVIAILGRNIFNNLEHKTAEQDNPKMQVEMYVPKPKGEAQVVSRSANDRGFVFVNSRPVVIKDVDKIIRQYNDLESSRYPVYVVIIALPTTDLDVNLDPNKTHVYLQHKESVMGTIKDMLDKLYGPPLKTCTGDKLSNNKDEAVDSLSVKSNLQNQNNDCHQTKFPSSPESLGTKITPADNVCSPEIPVFKVSIRSHSVSTGGSADMNDSTVDNSVHRTGSITAGLADDEKDRNSESNSNNSVQSQVTKDIHSPSFYDIHTKKPTAPCRLGLEGKVENTEYGSSSDGPCRLGLEGKVENTEYGSSSDGPCRLGLEGKVENTEYGSSSDGPCRLGLEGKVENTEYGSSSDGPCRLGLEGKVENTEYGSSSDGPCRLGLEGKVENTEYGSSSDGPCRLGLEGKVNNTDCASDGSKGANQLVHDEMDNTEMNISGSQLSRFDILDDSLCDILVDLEDKDGEKVPTGKTILDNSEAEMTGANVKISDVKGQIEVSEQNISDMLSSWKDDDFETMQGQISSPSLGKVDDDKQKSDNTGVSVEAKSKHMEAERWSKGQGLSKDNVVIQPVTLLTRGMIPTPTLDSHSPPTKRKKISEEKYVPTYDIVNSQPVKRKCTAFELFTRDITSKVVVEHPCEDVDFVSQIIEEKWNMLSSSARTEYKLKAGSANAQENLTPSRSIKKLKNRLKESASSSLNIRDQLLKSVSREVKVRNVQFDMKFLRQKLSSQTCSQVCTQDYTLSLIGAIKASSAWICCQGSQIQILNPHRIQETNIFHRLLKSHKLAAQDLAVPLQLTAGRLGSHLWESLIKLTRTSYTPHKVYSYITDERVTSNGIQVKFCYDDTDNLKAEVIGLCSFVPMYGTDDFIEILELITNSNTSTLDSARPLKVINYLKGEAVRMARQLPTQQTKEDVIEVLEKMLSLLPKGCNSCLHNKPFYYTLFDLDDISLTQSQIPLM